MINRHTIKILFLLIILILLGLAYLYWPASWKERKNVLSEKREIAVSVIKLKKEKLEEIEEFVGRVVPYEIAEVRPQVSGIITKRLFKEGSDVQEGEQLYEIDPAPYEAALHSAQANLAKAHANLKALEPKALRYKELVKNAAVSKQDYDDAQAQAASAKADIALAKAQVETAEINLKYTKVYAPISGKISKSQVTKGALVTANQINEITRITRLDPIYVDLIQSNEQLMRIGSKLLDQDGIVVNLIIDGYQDHGKLEFKDVTVNETTGTVMLRAIFPNKEKKLLPGLFVRAQINIGSKEEILLPQKAVILNADGSATVYVVDDQHLVNIRKIVLGKAIDGKWEVKDGLKESELVVFEGFQKITNGMKVTLDLKETP